MVSSGCRAVQPHYNSESVFFDFSEIERPQTSWTIANKPCTRNKMVKVSNILHNDHS